MMVDEKTMENSGKINNIEQLCYARKYTVSDGRAKGIDVIEVANGKLNFLVLCSNGFDIYNLSHKGTNISFISKGGLVNFNGDFGDRFPGGMLYTCGLETVGAREMPIHGRIHNIPGEIEKIYVDENLIEIVGVVKQNGLFKDNLTLKRTITTKYNSDKVEITTEIVNCGFKSAEYCLLFHMNIGYPMLDEGVKVIAPVLETEPRTPWAESNIEKCFVMENPLSESEEQVFFHKVAKGNVKVINEKLKKQVVFNYNNEMLPYFIEWKSMIKGDYALGIEPSTTTLDGGFNRKTLASGKKDCYKITIEVNDLE